MEAIRKLIDIKAPVFYTLSAEASRRKISLKRLIEEMLEKEAASKNRKTPFLSPSVRRLVGSAKPETIDLEAIKDDRLQYLLSK